MGKRYGWSAWDPLTDNSATGTVTADDSCTDEQAKQMARQWLHTEHYGKFSVPTITVWEEGP